MPPKGNPPKWGQPGGSGKSGFLSFFSCTNFLQPPKISSLFFPAYPAGKRGYLLPTASSPNALHSATETPFIPLPKRPSQSNRNALHTATETPFILQPKRTFFFCKNAPCPGRGVIRRFRRFRRFFLPKPKASPPLCAFAPSRLCVNLFIPPKKTPHEGGVRGCSEEQSPADESPY